MKKHVILGLSGGVDSSVAAYLLKKQGYEVTGLTMRLIPKGELFKNSEKAFQDAVIDAKRVADYLDIPHVIVDMREVFENTVIEYFVQEYGRGRTPNPCIFCNKNIKFGALLAEAKKLGGDYLATGHYAKNVFVDGKYVLQRAKDQKKDQTYFLYHLSQEVLSKVLFPLGDYTKNEIREIAEAKGLPNHSRSDSEEICFVQKLSAGDFVECRNPELNKNGVFKNPEGQSYGTHKGIVHYTVGQRRGLGVATGTPLYITEIMESGDILLDTEKGLLKHHILLDNVIFPSGEPDFSKEYRVKIRHGLTQYPAKIIRENGEISLFLSQPARGVAIGQSAVIYGENSVVGGGIMIKAW